MRNVVVNDEVLLAKRQLRVAIRTFLLCEVPIRNQHRLRSNYRL
jgi:hypothetical protein